jgi:hypothetical protein
MLFIWPGQLRLCFHQLSQPQDFPQDAAASILIAGWTPITLSEVEEVVVA